MLATANAHQQLGSTHGGYSPFPSRLHFFPRRRGKRDAPRCEPASPASWLGENLLVEEDVTPGVWMDRDPYPSLRRPTIQICQPPPPIPEADRAPRPALHTLWISARSSEEIAALELDGEATLAAGAALCFSISCACVIVHLSLMSNSTVVARLPALDAEEVILTETGAADTYTGRGQLGVEDTGKVFPGRCYPSRRDWPTKRYRTELREGAW
ncbi:hypothetical protein LXA43DRAFT_588675 [Ganoderma leucocontextum]|nr:hypothetical protein LXA43DRAFT_588675 [Ganoderma leucocontextum]